MLRSAYGKGSYWHVSNMAIPFKRSVKICLLLLVSLHLQAFLPGESQMVTLSFKEAPLQRVFAAIRKQTGYTFVYADADLFKAKPVNINITNTRIADALTMIFANQPFSYTVIERVITIQLKGEKKIDKEQSSLQLLSAIDIRGRVLNEKGEPVAGVSVMVKGTQTGTYTNGDGEFMLSKVAADAILLFTAVNIQPVEQSVNGRRILDIKVQGKTGKLDEVQVIAYGTTSKRFTTGNTATVKAEDIERQPVNNPLLSLQGRVPGLEVVQANGIPGGGITIRIQGRNNINHNLVGSDPFIVIDGVPYMSQNLTTFLGGAEPGRSIMGRSGDNSLTGSFGNPLAFINPNDIESIDVLKDADATAIYGSRAANGAILITTKRGKAGPMQVNLNLQQGWGRVGHKMDLLNSEQYMEMRREAKRNDNAAILATDYDLRGLWDTTRYTDWQKELIGRRAHYTNLTAGVSGGNQMVQYFVSGTWARETSVFPGSFANTRASVHFNVAAASPSQRLKVQLGGSYMANDNKLPGLDFTEAALNLPPVAPPLFNVDGTLHWAPDPLAGGNSSWFNPLARQYNLFDTKTGNFIANGSLSYRILPGLELKSSFGFTSTSSDQFTGALNQSFKPEARPGRLRSANFSFNDVRSWIVEPQLSYQYNLGSDRLNLLVGSTFQQQRSEGWGFRVSGQPSDQLLRNMEAGGTFNPAGSDLVLYRYSALFARIGYTHKNRYLVNLTARRDGSSRFGAHNQLHNFGAVGLGWILSEESFFKRILPFISFAKLRGSYGSTGNDQLGNYRFMSLYRVVISQVPYQGQQGLRPESLPNPNLEWEATRKLQAGMDFGFLNDRLLLTVNYIRNRSSNSLTEISLPIVAGFSNINDNLAALVQNTGWEFSLNTENVQSKHFQWSSSVNLTIPRNKLLVFPDLTTSSLGYLLVEGKPLNIRKFNAFYGVDPRMGTYLVSDQHGNPTTTPGAADLNRIYQTGIRWYGGFQNSLRYKGFELEVFFHFTKQYALHLLDFGIPGRIVTGTSTSGNQPIGVLQRWQKPGDITIYQRFTSTTALGGLEKGDRGFGDASYVRLKNLSVSYRFSPIWLQKLSMQQLRLFLNIQNLLTFTRYEGLDPENLSSTSLPPLRMVAVGVQAGF